MVDDDVVRFTEAVEYTLEQDHPNLDVLGEHIRHLAKCKQLAVWLECELGSTYGLTARQVWDRFVDVIYKPAAMGRPKEPFLDRRDMIDRTRLFRLEFYSANRKEILTAIRCKLDVASNTRLGKDEEEFRESVIRERKRYMDEKLYTGEARARSWADFFIFVGNGRSRLTDKHKGELLAMNPSEMADTVANWNNTVAKRKK